MTSYFHYVGGKYTPEKFIAEAREQGISRRAPASQVKSMSFGDRVILLDWRGGRPAAFAEFVISRVFFDPEISKAVGEGLLEDGRCEFQDFTADGGGGVEVDRACGSYTIGGAFMCKDDVTLGEVFERAEEADKARGGDGNLWCMVGGYLTQTYPVPMTVLPAPAFTRSFMQVPEGGTNGVRYRIGEAPIVNSEAAKPQVVIVENYEKTH